MQIIHPETFIKKLKFNLVSGQQPHFKIIQFRMLSARAQKKNLRSIRFDGKAARVTISYT